MSGCTGQEFAAVLLASKTVQFRFAHVKEAFERGHRGVGLNLSYAKRLETPAAHETKRAMELSLASLPDDALRHVVRACAQLLDPKKLVYLATACHHFLELCNPE